MKTMRQIIDELALEGFIENPMTYEEDEHQLNNDNGDTLWIFETEGKLFVEINLGEKHLYNEFLLHTIDDNFGIDQIIGIINNCNNDPQHYFIEGIYNLNGDGTWESHYCYTDSHTCVHLVDGNSWW